MLIIYRKTNVIKRFFIAAVCRQSKFYYFSEK